METEARLQVQLLKKTQETVLPLTPIPSLVTERQVGIQGRDPIKNLFELNNLLGLAAGQMVRCRIPFAESRASAEARTIWQLVIFVSASVEIYITGTRRFIIPGGPFPTENVTPLVPRG
jgi:hypothetical protein